MVQTSTHECFMNLRRNGRRRKKDENLSRAFLFIEFLIIYGATSQGMFE